MTYEDAMLLLSDMKSRYDDGFSSSDRSVLETLHRQIYGRGITNKGCGDCYRDAYILIVTKLKQTKSMPKNKSNYTLKAGAIIRRAGDNRFYTNPLPNDEVPEQYLAEFPAEINKFASYPNDWQARVALRASGTLPEGELSQEEAKNIIDGLREDLRQKDVIISTLKQELENGETYQAAPVADESEEIGNLRLELSALTADIESKNAEIVDLKAEIASLKEAAPKRTTRKSTKEE